MRRVDLLNGLQRIADTVGDQPGQDVLFAEINTLLEHHPDDQRQARLLVSMALRAARGGDAVAFERLARQSLALAERCGAAWWAAVSRAQPEWLQITRQHYSTAVGHTMGCPQHPRRDLAPAA